MSTTPRISKLAGTVQWDDGENFDGYVKCALALPSGWTEVAKKANQGIAKVILPLWSIIPIEDGAFSQEVGLYYNSDMTPHNSKYNATYFDKTLTQVASTTANFVVSSATTTVPIPTLTAPVAPA